jgi:SHS2 domain-containing protein
MFETFDHTADLGLRAWGPDLNTLFADIARALTTSFVDNPETIRPTRQEQLDIESSSLDYLLFDWLSELLYRYETEQLLFFEFDVRIDELSLAATVRGEPADPDRHRLSHEVKAITYHGLKVEKQPDEWLAEVIVDI